MRGQLSYAVVAKQLGMSVHSVSKAKPKRGTIGEAYNDLKARGYAHLFGVHGPVLYDAELAEWDGAGDFGYADHAPQQARPPKRFYLINEILDAPMDEARLYRIDMNNHEWIEERFTQREFRRWLPIIMAYCHWLLDTEGMDDTDIEGDNDGT